MLWLLVFPARNGAFVRFHVGFEAILLVFFSEYKKRAHFITLLSRLYFSSCTFFTLILPYLFRLLGYDPILDGVTVVRCGGKSEIDRFYRLYSEFGIPCFIIFDGDYHNKGKQDEKGTIDKNHGILSIFGVDADFPDDTVTDNYLGFKYRLEENLGIGEVGEAKALRLYQRTKEVIKRSDQVPVWVHQVIEKIKALPMEAESILLEE